MPRPRKPAGAFRYFNFSLKVIRLVVMMYVRFPLSQRNLRRSPPTACDLQESHGRARQRRKAEIGRWANNRVENSHLPFRRRKRAHLYVAALDEAE